MLHTAFIERFNGTVRSRLAPFARRTGCLARTQVSVERGLYLVGTLYNFCCFHCSLTVEGRRQTPAMAAGITDHCWSVAELLSHPSRRLRGSHPVAADGVHASYSSLLTVGV